MSARESFVMLFSNEGDAKTFEKGCLAIPRAMLPAEAQSVLDGSEPGSAYWSWLSGLASRLGAVELRASSLDELFEAQGFGPSPFDQRPRIAPALDHGAVAIDRHLAYLPVDPNAFSGPVRVGWTSPECSHFAGTLKRGADAQRAERDNAPTTISGARFAAIWEKRGPMNTLSGRMTDAEDALVSAHWKTMGGDSCWDDAFHALWRTTDPEGHAKLFSGTFYATAESMRDDDEDGGSR